MKQSLKCLHCGHEYMIVVNPKQEILERVCPNCRSNSVRKLPSKKRQ